MNLRKTAAAVAVALAIGGGMAGQAHADAFAGAFIDITNFIITEGDGTAIDSPGDITIQSFVDRLQNSASLNVESDFALVVSPPAPTPDARQACVTLSGGVYTFGSGACLAPPNTFAIQDPPAPEDPTHARADSQVEGQPFDAPGDPAGVHAGTVAEASISDPLVFGTAGGDITLTSSFTFTADQNQSINIEFDARTFLQAWTASGTGPGTSATAENNWTLSLFGADPTTPLIFWQPGGADSVGLLVTSEPCDLNEATTVGASNPAAPVINNCSGSFQAFATVDLTAGTTYAFVISHGSLALANQVEGVVPEPSSLLLLGLGLAGFGFARRYLKAA